MKIPGFGWRYSFVPATSALINSYVVSTFWNHQNVWRTLDWLKFCDGQKSGTIIIMSTAWYILFNHRKPIWMSPGRSAQFRVENNACKFFTQIGLRWLDILDRINNNCSRIFIATVYLICLKGNFLHTFSMSLKTSSSLVGSAAPIVSDRYWNQLYNSFRENYLHIHDLTSPILWK